MAKFLATFLTFLVLSTVTLADDSERDYAKCAALEGDLGRLECFDQLGKSQKLDRPQSVSEDTHGEGKWHVQEEINPIDDSQTVLLILYATSGKGSYGDAVSLSARCKSKRPEVYINWHAYLGSEASVLTRIGDEKARTSSWNLSNDSTATFHPNGKSFLEQILRSNKLVAQITPYKESPITAVFDTTGLQSVLVVSNSDCWSNAPPVAGLNGDQLHPGLGGASLIALNDSVEVVSVDEGSPAQSIKLQVGDRISAANRKPVASLKQFEAIARDAEKLFLLVQRGDRSVMIKAH